MKIDKISLKWKIFGYILFLTLAIVVVFCVFQILLLDNVYRGTKLKQTKKLMEDVYRLVDQQDVSLILDKTSSLTIQLNELVKDLESNCYIIKKEQVIKEENSNIPESNFVCLYPFDDLSDFDGKINFADLFNQINVVEKPMFVVTDDLEHEYFHQLISEDDKIVKNNDIIYCQRVELADHKSTYMIILYARITPVQPAIKTLKTQLLYITLIVLALAILFAIIISRLISKPLIDMTNEAKKLASGDYDLDFKGHGFLEISELNDTLNYALRELKKTETLKRELLANVSHDLKTPLTLISGYAEVIRDFPTENQSANVQIIIDEANRLKLLVNDLLELSRINAQSEPLKKSNFNLTKLIIEIVERQQKLVESIHFKINFHYDALISIEGDALKIAQVIYNFLTNAINYSKDQHIVDIVQEINNDDVIVKFIDYGIGIKEEEQPLVWQRYYRLDKTHTRSSQGTGLGLAIVKSILDYHGFKYGVISKENEGSTFWFSTKYQEKHIK